MTKTYSFLIRKWYAFHFFLWPMMMLLGVAGGQWMLTKDHGWGFVAVPAWLVVYLMMTKRRAFKKQRKESKNAV